MTHLADRISTMRDILSTHDRHDLLDKALRCAVSHGSIMTAGYLSGQLRVGWRVAQGLLSELCDRGLMSGPSEREGLYYVNE